MLVRLPPIDPDLVLRYDRPGPRYTSYPPAPFFREVLGPREYRSLIAARNEATPERPLSLYLHIPFCRSVCYFCGCNVHFTKDRSLAEPYVERLLREMGTVAGLLEGRAAVEQIHWGGGTPTFLPASWITRLADGIRESFDIAPDAEIGVELDPREVDEEKLRALAGAGFWRVSMGVQDFDPEVQEAVHRRQPFDLTRRTIEQARELGFRSVNIDLMYGLPLQTPERVRATLERVLELAPDRLAVFNFAYLPEAIPHQRGIHRDELPEARTKLEILALVIERLTDAGYVYIGMDHFARHDDELAIALENGTLHRNFQGYTTRSGCDLFGIGATSIGQVGAAYVQNLKDVAAWAAAVDRDGLASFRGIRLSADDELRRDVIQRLMCRFVVVKEEVEREHGIRFDETFAAALEELRPMANDGLIELERDRIVVQPLGRVLIRNIAMAFDAYRKRDDVERYSRTV